MTAFRRWSSAAPVSLTLAADARFSRTDYADDQSWTLIPGEGEAPALALQTRYGGRAGLVSLLPLWTHEGRAIYQALTYARVPTLAILTPSYACLEGELLPRLALSAEYWVTESHALGGRYMLRNQGKQPVSLRLEAFGHVGIGGKEQKLGLVSLSNGETALSFGRVGNLEPVVLQEHSNASELAPGITPKIGTPLTIAPGQQVSVRWVHAARSSLRESLRLADHWLNQDWDAGLAHVARAAAAIPQIDTGDAELNQVINLSYLHLVQAFLKPTDRLPHASFVATRSPAKGFSAAGDGREYDRGWSGQNMQSAYLTAAAVAAVDPLLAEGVIRNYLAVQTADGTIDGRPGLGGQRENLLCAPLLARLTWTVYQQTGSTAFVKEMFPGLLTFFQRWFASDADGDTFPEWQHERQTGYVYFPTFGVTQPWAQGLDIRSVESPDLLGYLLSEAASLRAMATLIGEAKAQAALDKSIKALGKLLDTTWSEDRGHFVYRDRQTHATPEGAIVVENRIGDEEALPSMQFTPANRVIVSINGGLSHTPDVTLTLTGSGANGEPVTEVVRASEFAWRTGGGRYTSKHVFSQLDRVRCDGLSRVYRYNVRSADLTGLDLNGLLPLCVPTLKKTRAAVLAKRLLDPDQFWRASGVSLVPAHDSRYDGSLQKGGGGVGVFWTTLIGEGLLHYGMRKPAEDLVKRMLRAQSVVLHTRGDFSEWYHADLAQGLAEEGHISGIAPLYLLQRLIGVLIHSPRRVWISDVLAWSSSVTVWQHGVQVKRSRKGTMITFPSGHQATLLADAAAQEVVDPTVEEIAADVEPLPAAPEPSPVVPPVEHAIRIEVQYDDE